ncbi:MAG: electron transfer flavoprotein subunit beta/FixA family protein [Myxococcota bacterium]
MKILVPCKRVSDPDNANKVKVADDGASLSAEGLEWKPNPFDDWAVETALRLNENASNGETLGEIVVVSLGPSDASQAIRQFLAMGADRGILVKADDESLDSYVVARALKAVVDKEQPDMVLMGKQSADGESGAVGAILAELLGWPMSTGSMNIVTDDGGKTFTVGREADGGMLKAKLTGPAVITVTDRILGPESVKNGVTPDDHAYPESDSGRYASLKGIMKAKKKPIDEQELSALGIDAAPTSSYENFSKPPARTGSTHFVENVDELVEKLKTEAKVL